TLHSASRAGRRGRTHHRRPAYRRPETARRTTRFLSSVLSPQSSVLMITSRGWWFLIITLAVLALGVLGGRLSLTLLALTPLLWFAGEWFWFSLRMRVIARSLAGRRRLWGERGGVDTLWAGRRRPVRGPAPAR